jgi:hypothetical protein
LGALWRDAPDFSTMTRWDGIVSYDVLCFLDVVQRGNAVM